MPKQGIAAASCRSVGMAPAHEDEVLLNAERNDGNQPAALCGTLPPSPVRTTLKDVRMNASDTAFILICASMVMLMTPALALFYGGLVRSRNILSTHMHSYGALALISVLWAVVGYTLAFGEDVGGIIGDLSYLFLKGVMSRKKQIIPMLTALWG